ncbi:MAG: protein-tyrosine phosphatase [Colwellia sp.]|jgi:protein-tyrosine phosphatase
MIDLHCHLLPGIDDGAQTEEESIGLLQQAIADGITHMVLTSHVQPGRYNNNLNNLQIPFQRLQEIVKERQLTIKLSLGGEVRLCDEILQLFADDNIPFIGTYNNKKVLLLELPHNSIPAGSDKLIDWLMERNILPMIAHPERNKAIIDDISKAKPFIMSGCLFQLTAMSVTGDFGKKAYGIAHQFLDQGLATIIASDAHNSKRRPAILSKAFNHVAEKYSEALAKELLIETPGRILASR